MSITAQLNTIKNNVPLVYQAGRPTGLDLENNPVRFSECDNTIQLTDISSIKHKIRISGPNLFNEDDFFNVENWNECSYNNRVFKYTKYFPCGKYNISFNMDSAKYVNGYSLVVCYGDMEYMSPNIDYDNPFLTGKTNPVISYKERYDGYHEVTFFADNEWTFYVYFNGKHLTYDALKDLTNSMSNIKIESRWYNQGYETYSNPDTVNIYGPNLWDNARVTESNTDMITTNSDGAIVVTGYECETLTWQEFHEMTGLHPGEKFYISYKCVFSSAPGSGTACGEIRFKYSNGEYKQLSNVNSNNWVTRYFATTNYIPDDVDDSVVIVLFGRTGGTGTFSDIIISKNEITEYCPYQEKQTITLDGLKELPSDGLKLHHISSINEKTINVEYMKSYDSWYAYNMFWDNYQENGNRTNYAFAFAGDCWNDAIDPKYQISGPIYSYFMFRRHLHFFDMTKSAIFKNNTIVTTSAASLFQIANITNIGIVDMTKNTVTNGLLFANSNTINRIEKVIVSASTNIGSNSFNASPNITHVVFEGDIRYSLSFASQTKLDKESILSIINCLYDASTSQTITFNTNAINKQFETSDGANDGSASTEWTNLITTKPNWTFALS